MNVLYYMIYLATKAETAFIIHVNFKNYRVSGYIHMKTLVTIIALIILAVVIGMVTKKPTNTPTLMTTDTAPTQTLTENQKPLSVTESSFTWTGKKTIIKDWIDTGSVMMREGYIVIDQDMVTGGQAIIDMTSITAATTGSGSGQDKLSQHLQSADFFDVANHATAQIMINRIADGVAYADITIKGITKAVEFPIAVEKTDAGYTLSGKLSLNRTWFDVKFGSKAFFADLVDKMVIDDMFTIDFKVVAK